MGKTTETAAAHAFGFEPAGAQIALRLGVAGDADITAGACRPTAEAPRETAVGCQSSQTGAGGPSGGRGRTGTVHGAVSALAPNGLSNGWTSNGA